MTPDQEKTWKAISKTELKLAERMTNPYYINLDELDNREIIADLQEKLNGDYTLEQIDRPMNPHTLEPMTVIRLTRKKRKRNSS